MLRRRLLCRDHTGLYDLQDDTANWITGNPAADNIIAVIGAASQSYVVAVPKITSVTVSSKTVAVSDKLELTVGRSLVVNGTTTPGGKVIVTVHSDPVETPVTADDSGYGNLTSPLTNLPCGDHSIDVVAVDADGVKSVTTSPIAFSLKPAVVTSTAKTTQSKSRGSKSRTLHWS